MYVKINDYKRINTDEIQEVYIQDKTVYARINGTPYSLYVGTSVATANQFLNSFMKTIKAEEIDMSKILEEAFPPEVTSLSISPKTVNQNGVVTITINLSKAVNSTSDITLTVDNKMTVKTALALNTAKTQATATYTATTVGTCNISVKTVKGITTKTDKVTINEVPAVLKTVVAVPNAIDVGATTVVTATFDKAPKLADVQVSFNTTNLQQTVAPAISGNTVTLTLKGLVASASDVTVTHKSVSLKAKVTVNAPASASEVEFGKRALID